MVEMPNTHMVLRCVCSCLRLGSSGWVAAMKWLAGWSAQHRMCCSWSTPARGLCGLKALVQMTSPLQSVAHFCSSGSTWSQRWMLLKRRSGPAAANCSAWCPAPTLPCTLRHCILCMENCQTSIVSSNVRLMAGSVKAGNPHPHMVPLPMYQTFLQPPRYLTQDRHPYILHTCLCTYPKDFNLEQCWNPNGSHGAAGCYSTTGLATAAAAGI